MSVRDPDLYLDPTARSYTALFRVLGNLLASLRAGDGGGIVYPVNRAGQNVAECYTLAGLTFVLLTSCFIDTVAGLLGGQIWSFVAAVPLALMLTFVVLHLLFLSFAYVYDVLKSIHLIPASASKQLPVAVYLLFFTGMAVAMVLSGKVFLMFAASPWLLALALNFVCAVILFAEKFLAQIKGEQG
ncbi:MAG: hypothetical protein QM496_08275 [Verrucomicrobiota bacterium]